MYDDKQAVLIQAAIRAVAQDGLERTTTRSIGAAAGINDAYIYRCFSDKEDLLSRAYMLVNEDLISLLIRRMKEARKSEIIEGYNRFAYVIRGLWDALLDKPEICIFCDYYYHSASYKKHTAELHHAETMRLLDKMGEEYSLRPQAEFSFYHLMETLFAFATKAVEGYYPKTEDGFEQVAARLYMAFRSIVTHKAES